MKFNPKFKQFTQITKARNLEKMAGDEAFLMTSPDIDSRHISPKEMAFLSEDTTDCWKGKLLRVNSSVISKALFAK